MSSNLQSFFNNYASFSNEEFAAIEKQFITVKVKKHAFLLEQGQICQNLIYVKSGCLRLYYIANEVEISVWFAFPNSSAIEIHSFISQQPSNYFLQAIEDSEILYLPYQTLQDLYKTMPKMQEMMRRYWEDVVITLLERFTNLQKDDAEKRYRDLLNKPDYLQTIPQKYLASFIGVTPTSLSRIRKVIGRNH